MGFHFLTNAKYLCAYLKKDILQVHHGVPLYQIMHYGIWRSGSIFTKGLNLSLIFGSNQSESVIFAQAMNCHKLPFTKQILARTNAINLRLILHIITVVLLGHVTIFVHLIQVHSDYTVGRISQISHFR